MALGLAAVCGIVKQSGGTMGVESRPEGGTMIRVYLPRVEAVEPAAGDPPAVTGPATAAAGACRAGSRGSGRRSYSR